MFLLNIFPEHKLVRNRLIKAFPTYHKEYDLSLDIKPIGVVKGWGSIIHVTKGDDIGEHGDRIPGIWFSPGTRKPYVCTSIGNNKNHCVTRKTDLPTNKFTNIRVSQAFRPDTNTYWHFINIDRKLVYQVQNPNPISLGNVKVFMADPWYASAKALVKNVKVSTLQGG